MRVAHAVKTYELVALNTIIVSYKVGKRMYVKTKQKVK